MKKILLGMCLIGMFCIPKIYAGFGTGNDISGSSVAVSNFYQVIPHIVDISTNIINATDRITVNASSNTKYLSDNVTVNISTNFTDLKNDNLKLAQSTDIAKLNIDILSGLLGVSRSTDIAKFNSDLLNALFGVARSTNIDNLILENYGIVRSTTGELILLKLNDIYDRQLNTVIASGTITTIFSVLKSTNWIEGGYIDKVYSVENSTAWISGGKIDSIRVITSIIESTSWIKGGTVDIIKSVEKSTTWVEGGNIIVTNFIATNTITNASLTEFDLLQSSVIKIMANETNGIVSFSPGIKVKSISILSEGGYNSVSTDKCGYYNDIPDGMPDNVVLPRIVDSPVFTFTLTAGTTLHIQVVGGF